MDKKKWFKENGIGIAIITLLVGNFYWTDAKIDSKFMLVEGKFDKIDARFAAIDARFAAIEKDVAIIKAVMLMKNILPADLAKKDE